VAVDLEELHVGQIVPKLVIPFLRPVVIELVDRVEEIDSEILSVE
jgi:hypothetical protein